MWYQVMSELQTLRYFAPVIILCIFSVVAEQVSPSNGAQIGDLAVERCVDDLNLDLKYLVSRNTFEEQWQIQVT